MTIRDATLEDIPELVEMGRHFAAKAAPHVGFDADSVSQLLRGLIENPLGLCLRGDNSMFGAITFPHPFNNAHKACQELFWWSEGREGIALLNEAIRRADAAADSMVMITLESVHADRMAQFYMKRGFRPMERGFVKDF